MDEFIPICCCCSKVRDDKGVKIGEGPWVDLKTYARNRHLLPGQRFIFTHGYCIDCLALFYQRMAIRQPTNVLTPLNQGEHRLFAETCGRARETEHLSE